MAWAKTIGCILAAASFMFCSVTSLKHADTSTCANVRDEFVRLKLGSAKDVPTEAIHDASMQICYQGSQDADKTSCCSRHMEEKYREAAEADFHQILQSTSLYLRNLLATNKAHYYDYFTKLLTGAENATLCLFRDIYSQVPSNEISAIVRRLFTNLSSYVSHRNGHRSLSRTDVKTSIERFFNQLFPLVFQHILTDGSASPMTPVYRDCLLRVYRSVKPPLFGSVGTSLSTSLSEAVDSARSLLLALRIGEETIDVTAKVPVTSTCGDALTRALYCPHCARLLPRSRPCRHLCLNIMRGCLAAIAEVDRHWDSFVDAVTNAGEHIGSATGSAAVLSEVHMHISEAIMHAMQTAHKFYPQVTGKCSQSTNGLKAHHQMPTVTSSGSRSTTSASSTSSAKSPDKFEQFARSLASTRGFYRGVADTLCTTDRFSAALEESCWNGYALAPYNKTVAGIGIDKQMSSNPEVRVEHQTSTLVSTVVDKLIHIRKLLHSKSGVAASHGHMQADDWSVKYDTHGGGGAEGSGHRRGGNHRGREGSGGGYRVRRPVGTSDDEDDYYSGSGSGTDYWEPKYNTPTDDIYIVENPSSTPRTGSYNNASRLAPGGSMIAALLSALLVATSICTILRHN